MIARPSWHPQSFTATEKLTKSRIVLVSSTFPSGFWTGHITIWIRIGSMNCCWSIFIWTVVWQSNFGFFVLSPKKHRANLGRMMMFCKDFFVKASWFSRREKMLNLLVFCSWRIRGMNHHKRCHCCFSREACWTCLHWITFARKHSKLDKFWPELECWMSSVEF